MIDDLTKEMFAENLNTKFRIPVEAADPVEIELIELKVGVETPTHQQFTLLFLGPQNIFLPQQIYHVEHDKFGDFELFLVPVAQKPEGFQYEAVFNRLSEKG